MASFGINPLFAQQNPYQSVANQGFGNLGALQQQQPQLIQSGLNQIAEQMQQAAQFKAALIAAQQRQQQERMMQLGSMFADTTNAMAGRQQQGNQFMQQLGQARNLADLERASSERRTESENASRERVASMREPRSAHESELTRIRDKGLLDIAQGNSETPEAQAASRMMQYGLIPGQDAKEYARTQGKAVQEANVFLNMYDSDVKAQPSKKKQITEANRTEAQRIYDSLPPDSPIRYQLSRMFGVGGAAASPTLPQSSGFWDSWFGPSAVAPNVIPAPANAMPSTFDDRLYQQLGRPSIPASQPIPILQSLPPEWWQAAQDAARKGPPTSQPYEPWR